MWLSIAEYGLRLNISREHEWGEETQIYPIYVQAYCLEKDKFIDGIPVQLVQRFQNNIGSKIEIYAGKYIVDIEEGEPIRVIE